MSRLSGAEYVTLYNWKLRKHPFNMRIHIGYSLNEHLMCSYVHDGQ